MTAVNSSVRKVPINRQAEIALKKQYLLRNNVWSRDCARINESCGDLVFATKLGGPINDQNVCDAMEKSPYDATKIKKLLNSALTEEINDREIFMKWVRRSGARDTG